MKNNSCRGKIVIDGVPPHFITSGILQVEVSNKSDEDWKSDGPNPVNLSYHWLGEYENVVVFDGARTPLPPGGIRAGTSATISARIDLPEIPGEYRLVVTLVCEGMHWFDEAENFEAAQVKLRIGPEINHTPGPRHVLGTDWIRPELYDPGRNFGFMHVPKTAGAAMRSFLHNALRPVPTEIDCAGVGVYVHWVDSKLSGKTNYAGHLALTNLSKYCPDGQFLTVFREPSSRIVSHWLFWRTFAQPPSAARRDEKATPLVADVVSLTGGAAEKSGDQRSPVMCSVDKLIDVLSDPRLADHIDNVALRMLVWPHPRLPENGFIERKNDEELLNLAWDRLKMFAYLDVIENPRFEANLQDWLGTPVRYGRENITASTTKTLRIPLFREFTVQTLEALEERSRLDRILWKAVAAARMPGADIERLEREALIKNIARHAAIMSATGTGELAGWLTNLPVLMRVNTLYSIVQRFLNR